MNAAQEAAFARSMGRPGQVILAREFFVYSTPRTSLAAGASTTLNIAIQADSDFVIEKTTYNADVAAAATTQSTMILPNWTVMLTISGAGRQLMNTPVPIPGMFGTGQLPFIWTRPYAIPASSQLQIGLVSYEAAATDLVTLNFIGQKIFWGYPQ